MENSSAGPGEQPSLPSDERDIERERKRFSDLTPNESVNSDQGGDERAD